MWCHGVLKSLVPHGKSDHFLLNATLLVEVTVQIIQFKLMPGADVQYK